MRNEALTGYILHHRPYQEKRAIYYIFTQQYGVIHGIGKKGAPLFVPLQMFASGKNALKTLQQINISNLVTSLVGQNQYAGLYINELTLQLLAIEDQQSLLYQTYETTLDLLREPLDDIALRLALRHYEQCLFTELGFAIDFFQDTEGELISTNLSYVFDPQAGFVNIANTKINNAYNFYNQSKNNDASQYKHILIGSDIIAMQQGIKAELVWQWGVLHRQLIDYLFDYQPLQSRILWQQFAKYQN
ncbi:DNA repair protein RecO [Psychrobacter sp. I-STPA10]|uniref:DNA repair protein RecO n=1 Tax=Psychrobacter sp. I-STPA10 TaxID=2585769 RepID=UPI001E5F2A91|nr:DNA repair protein RecO C-terminal domain-containing protein [Psychrobacter sp. I-STPA10]